MDYPTESSISGGTFADTAKVEYESSTTPTEVKQTLNVLHRIWLRIRVARRQIRRRGPKFKKFYSKVKTILNDSFAYEWLRLPKRLSLWYETEVKRLEKRDQLNVMLPILYEALINYLHTFDEMRQQFGKEQVTVSPSFYKGRRVLLNQIITHLKSVLEEVEMAVIHYDLVETTLGLLEKSEASRNRKSSGWNPRPDHTRTLIQDWGVFSSYYAFLKDWLKISRTVYHEFCNSSNATHKCHKILNSN